MVGFYLSPCGNYIVQVQKDKSWKYGLEVIGESCGFVDSIFDGLAIEDFPLIFSSWFKLK